MRKGVGAVAGRAHALCVVLGVLAALPRPAAAQPPVPSPRIEDMSLEQLLDVDVEVPSGTVEPLRESSGVVTVVTREEMLATGARDLLDVLMQVPGFQVGVDVQGATSVGFRGNWGEEGKVLLLVDGLEMNEPLYLTFQLGNRYPVDLIERVEIMRGPGSVVYGGMAELAVIHVITRSPAHDDGVFVSGVYGQLDGGLGRRTLSLYAGHTFTSLGDLAVSVSGSVGEGRRSDADYQDFFGHRYSLTSAALDPLLLNLGVSWQGLSLRFIFDDLRTRARDAFDVSEPAFVQTDFPGYFLDVRYALALSACATLTPRFAFKHQRPWLVDDPVASPQTYYRKSAQRFTGGLTLDWKIVKGFQLLLGAEVLADRAELDSLAHVGVGLQQLFNGATRSAFETYAGYAQALVESGDTHLVFGARYEHNSHFEGTFVPRFALTQRFERFHFKLLFSKAFKPPGHENLGLNPDLRPEHTTTFELETGLQLGDHLYLGANAFDITIKDPIVFNFTDRETYTNFPQTGTRGVEAEVRLKYPAGWATLKYAFYTPSGKNEVPTYAVPGQPDVLRGFAPHTLMFESGLELFDGLTLNPSAILIGPRWGALDVDAAGTPVTGREPAKLLVNFRLSYRNLGVKGLDVSLGLYNVLDEKFRFLQPHDSGHAPLPGLAREYLLRVAYTLPFDAL